MDRKTSPKNTQPAHYPSLHGDPPPPYEPPKFEGYRGPPSGSQRSSPPPPALPGITPLNPPVPPQQRNYPPKQAWSFAQQPLQPVLQQPTSWTVRPVIPGCPPGLECLVGVGGLNIRRQLDVANAVANPDAPSKYVCFNTMGQKIYYCEEEPNLCICGRARAARCFRMHVMDLTGTEVMVMERPPKFCCYFPLCSCSSCCQGEIRVEAPVGKTIGYVKQLPNPCCKAEFASLNEFQEPVLKIYGASKLLFSWFRNTRFLVSSVDGTSDIGEIKKNWDGLVGEHSISADLLTLEFPADLDVKIKAVLIGGAILLDYLYFGSKKSEQEEDRDFGCGRGESLR
ncbi:unnamed protein product [Calicophoron daubneyi]|uniref:Phospholipid scramblase n=1 Tax=Calicophoron daubneyi TaxID=300641 RepID=A0AAV2SZX5_CALDB